MKQLLLASTALGLVSQAMAADIPARMPVKAPILAPRVFSWTGCYAGAHLGAGWGRTSISEPLGYIANPGVPIDVNTGAGVLGGAQVGCDYQFASNWVIGAAGDFSWASIDGQATDPFFTGKYGNPITLSSKTEWLATATARLGYTWDRWMIYGKGGAAWAHDKYSIGNLVSWGNPAGYLCASAGNLIACNPSGSTTRSGWTAGLGIEWAFADNWSASLEYDHYGFGTRSVTLADSNTALPTSGPVNVKERIEAVKVGVNYHFWQP